MDADHRLDAMEAADRALDAAWLSQTDLAAALAEAKRRSEEIGRYPLIEDAKVILAAYCGCLPSEGFEMLRTMSQRQNRKLHLVSCDVVAWFLSDMAEDAHGR